MGLIDLNTTEDDETPSSGSSASLSSHSGMSTSASTLGPSSSSVCLELWHACAGPMISLPKKGSVVVYFPQGHFEQQLQDFPVAACNIPPHVFCRVVDVKLHVSIHPSFFFSSQFWFLLCRVQYWVSVSLLRKLMSSSKFLLLLLGFC